MTGEVAPATGADVRAAWSAVAAAFHAAAPPPPAQTATATYALAGLTFQVSYAGTVGQSLTPGLRHLEVPAVPPDLKLFAFDAPPPLSDESLRALVPAGMPGARTDREIHVAYRRPDSGLSLFDERRSEALYWVRDGNTIPAWERAAPFRGIFSLWMAARGLRFVHGAAVGSEGSAVLLVGRGGSGKSTTALTCFAAGMDYAGDDYCVVDVANLTVFPIYRSAKLHAENVGRVPWLAGKAVNEGDQEEKLVYFPSPRGGGGVPASMRIVAIVLPNVTEHSSPRLTPTTGAAALAAIAPTTLLQLTHADSTALRDYALLAKRVPAFRLELGGDPAAVVPLLRGLLAR